MKFFLDTANIDEVKEAKRFGLIDGVTTNPTLLARETGDWRDAAKAICDVVDGPVSLEVFGEEAEDMLKEARDLISYGPNVVIKCPCTPEGLLATKILAEQGIPVNMTLIFSPLQALLAAKAGASYVSPFVGRLDAVGHLGLDLIEQIVTIFENYAFETEVLVASVRNPTHVLESALIGADICTIPFKVIMGLLKHPLTDSGLQSFTADAAKLK